MTNRYHIDFAWYDESDRSFSALARARLCFQCRNTLETDELSSEGLLDRFRECCSQDPDFITPRLPVLEAVFRIFLSNGNQPLTLEEIGQRLEKDRGDDFGLAADVLGRLLDNESYYGLRRLPGEPEEPNESAEESQSP